MRDIAYDFRPGTTTETHPVASLIALLFVAGFAWLVFIPTIKRYLMTLPSQSDQFRFAIAGVLIGLCFRALFLGSTPIYEDDWNRYLWDGAVVTQGVSPYVYSPKDIYEAPRTDDLRKLKGLSDENGAFVKRINNPDLTTIYPPVSQIAFAAAAIIKPFDLDALRGVFLLSEVIAFVLLLKALSSFGRSYIWVWLYALNPIVIFTAFNGAHMDILLVPFILGTILLVKTRPLLSAISLSFAVSIKLWPLILGPVLFSLYNQKLSRYVFYGSVLGGVSLLLCLPMLLHLGEQSGLQAYSETWQRSSFIFPYLETALSVVSEEGGTLARILIAIVVALTALVLGLRKDVTVADLPVLMCVLTVLFYLLSPTGFPWYIIWFAFLLPFVPSYGLALLCVLVSLYYARFWFGESGRYDIYLNLFVPLQFGLPIAVMMIECLRKRRHDRI